MTDTKPYNPFSATIDTVQENSKLRAENAGLREALEFYAAPETYFAIGFIYDRPCGPFIEDVQKTEYGLRPGKMAADALATTSDAHLERLKAAERVCAQVSQMSFESDLLGEALAEWRKF